jgi:lipopolysaccharide export LptBFGC system permease protein LptF
MNSKNTDLFNERQASFALVQELAQTKQDDIKAKNIETIKEEEQDKQDKNSEFWYRVRWVLNIVALIIIAATLFRVSK